MSDYAPVIATRRMLQFLSRAGHSEEARAAEDAIVRLVSDLCESAELPHGIPVYCRICQWPIGAKDHTGCLREAFRTVQYLS